MNPVRFLSCAIVALATVGVVTPSLFGAATAKQSNGLALVTARIFEDTSGENPPKELKRFVDGVSFVPDQFPTSPKVVTATGSGSVNSDTGSPYASAVGTNSFTTTINTPVATSDLLYQVTGSDTLTLTTNNVTDYPTDTDALANSTAYLGGSTLTNAGFGFTVDAATVAQLTIGRSVDLGSSGYFGALYFDANSDGNFVTTDGDYEVISVLDFNGAGVGSVTKLAALSPTPAGSQYFVFFGFQAGETELRSNNDSATIGGSYFGSIEVSSSIPEPTSLALLAPMALAVTRRRR
jgi:hypothetical protein